MPETAPQSNLRALVSWRGVFLQLALAAASGLLLSAAFPPLECGLLAWLALTPLLLFRIPLALSRRVLLGYVFGAACFVTNLFWLNTIGFGAGVWLGLFYALFLMLWYLLVGGLVFLFAERRAAAGRALGLWEVPMGKQCLLVLLLPAAWVALEWVRSWLFTGFPWNQLGISQWQRQNLLPLATVTGVYGISFLLVAVNVALAMSWRHMVQGWGTRERRGPSWPLLVAVLLLVPVLYLSSRQPRLRGPDDVLRVLAVQGCIPQCRVWSDAQFTDSLETYTSLSRAGVATGVRPDLIVWPETAVPVPLISDEKNREGMARRYPDIGRYHSTLMSLIAAVKTPFLIGAIDSRSAGGPTLVPPDPETAPTFNSAMLLDADGKVIEVYDKMHRVPFGEYTPFGQYLPWLVRWIGMGRDLTPGREYSILHLPKEVSAGVMICYEDAFPGIAREFVLRGAALLITLTNDAWYAESAGSRQHLLHAVLRAAETRRPLLRSGNNSDTCLIWPDGRITGLLVDRMTGQRFVRGSQLYDVPIWRNLPLTWYTRHGDLFAQLCALVTAAGTVWVMIGWWRGKEQRLEKITRKR